MQANDGKVIAKPDTKKQLCAIGPRNTATMSANIEFSSELTYPYTFTFMVANFQGEDGHYSVDVFCKDFDAKVQKIEKQEEKKE